MSSYPTVSLKSKTFEVDLHKGFDKYGVCVITDVVSPNECNKIMNTIVTAFENLGSGLKRDNPTTWDSFNTPTQTRNGMYQALMGNLPIIWKTKTKSEIVGIFESLYQKFKPKSSKKLVVSNDGINIKPGQVGPFNSNRTTDWPHLDQTSSSDPFMCIQGQLVMTNTTAAFRCTPGSHKHCDELLKIHKKLGGPGEWFKFSRPEAKDIKEWATKKGLEWQVPIYAPQGSFIVWTSSTIHSAKYADQSTKGTTKDPWKGWRGVLYISYRPRSDMFKKDIDMKKEIIKDNRFTNHWGTKIFGKYVSFRHKIEKKHPAIKDLNDNPEKLWTKLNINVDKEILNDPQVLKYIT